MKTRNVDLFECLAQGIIREFDRVAGNAGIVWYKRKEHNGCWEWWPPRMNSVSIPGVMALTIIDIEGDYWVTVECGGRSLQLDKSGKRIGMYGPDCEMTDSEMVDWFNRSMKSLNDFNYRKFRKGPRTGSAEKQKEGNL